MRSAIGSLVLGMTGQVIYHLLAAAHATRAPWPVTVVVACMPVATLGFGAALAHLMHADVKSECAPEAHPETAPETTVAPLASEPENALPTVPPEPLPAPRLEAPESAPRRTRKSAPVTAPEKRYADLLAAGSLPSLRQIRADMKVGQDRAKEIRSDLAASAASQA